MNQQELMAAIMAIQRDTTLTDAEKATKRQQLMAGKWAPPAEEKNEADDAKAEEAKASGSGLDDDTLKCAICFDLCVRPVTAPCQHNFCLKCFQDLVNKAKKKACPSCRHEFGAKFAANPRINTALTVAIRAFKSGDAPAAKAFVRINNDDRPDEAFTTERAQRAGRANAASGRIMVTVPNDHFGPIPPEADPRGLGIRVGEWWKDRLDCRQWGAHFPHVAGIAGQSNVGAQSVVLSGGYEDDRDEGEWFLYTGSGGRDLSGNKRTSKVQSHDQKFDSMNQALRLSCEKGLPVRVVRSFKEKRSAYAPGTETPVRYDGLYRITHCWRKKGAQGMLMCRYLFVRCDNEPAPWSSEDTGDRPMAEADLPKPALDEMKQADGKKVHTTKGSPWWDWNAESETWGWARAAPVSMKLPGGGAARTAKKKASEQEKALREFACGLCKNVLTDPLSTPCGHNFCKPCLDKKYAGIADEVDTGAVTGRSMRVRKTLKPCPTCKVDIMEFLQSAGPNREMAAVIRKLQEGVERARAEAAKEETAGGEEGEEEEGAEEEGAAAEEEEEEEAPQRQQQQQQQQEQAAAPAAAQAAESNKTSATDASGATGVKDSAVADHMVPNSAQGPSHPPAAAPAAASKQEITLRALCEEFPEFDAGLVEALLEQEDGDEAAVKYALRKMRNQVAAEEKKRQKQAKLDAKQAEQGKAAPPVTADDMEAQASEPAAKKAGAKKPAAGKRGKAAAAAAGGEDAPAAKKQKA